MIAELLVYLELLLFLAGALIYGFLTRELLRRPDVLPDNLPLRLALVCLTLFYGGTLADTVLFFMLDPAPAGLPGAAGTGLDLLRGVAWLVTLPLLLHALERIDARAPPAAAGGTERPSPLPGRVLVVAGYLALGLFVVPVARFAASGSIALADAARRWHPLLVALSALTLLPAAWLALGLARRVAERRLARFFRLLAGLMLGLLALVAAGLGLDPWNAGAQGLDRLLRTATLGALLLPGGLFVFYVQRYNLLRLSLSNRALRQFLTVLLVVLLVMLAGPAAGRELSEMRRFVAWGLTLALVVGLGSPLLSRWAERRSPRLRVLMGRGVTPGELDAFLDSVEGIDLEESAVLARAQERVGRWLGTRAAFLPDPEEDPETAPLWRHFRSGEEILVHRMAPADPAVAGLLFRRDLHAAFALRIDGRTEAILGLAASPTGGGYSDGELEAVQLVLRHLAASFSLRRLMAARLKEERRLAERERLGTLGLVSASLAHEIKNPLSSMKVLAQALREDLVAAPESEAVTEGVVDLDLIIEQIDRLHDTAREILRIARPGEGEAGAGPGVDLADFLASALYVLQAEARRQGVGLDGTAVEAVGRVPGSPAAWQTVVFNLVLNAIEHTAAGGSVEVALARRDGRVELATANPGPVLSEEEAQRLFEPFVSDGGTGLGLPLVARRLRELGGTVAVESRAGRVVFRASVPGLSPDEGQPEGGGG